MTRIVFMGTPEFAAPALERLASSAEYQIVGVYTQPDRPAGRGRKLTISPVKEFALARGLPVLQPTTLRTAEALTELIALQPDVIIVAAYGLILPKPVLDLPPHGCLNIHASLLPRYRGAAPIPAAILNGEELTGITIIKMDEGVDTGPMLAQMGLDIRPDETTATLTPRLARLGAEMLAQVLPHWLAGQIQPEAQDESRASFAPRLSKHDGRLDWSQPAIELERRVRAFDPWPGTFTMWQGKRVGVRKVEGGKWKVESGRLKVESAYLPPSTFHLQPSTFNLLPSTVIRWDDHIGVVTGDGVLELLEVQLEGRRPMRALDFARGQPNFVGSQLG